MVYIAGSIAERVALFVILVLLSCTLFDSKVQGVSKTSTGSVQSLPKEYFFIVYEISAVELLNTCSRDSANLLLPCCCGAAESPVDLTYQI